jgi:hypothetical protein
MKLILIGLLVAMSTAARAQGQQPQTLRPHLRTDVTDLTPFKILNVELIHASNNSPPVPNLQLNPIYNIIHAYEQQITLGMQRYADIMQQIDAQNQLVQCKSPNPNQQAFCLGKIIADANAAILRAFRTRRTCMSGFGPRVREDPEPLEHRGVGGISARRRILDGHLRRRRRGQRASRRRQRYGQQLWSVGGRRADHTFLFAAYPSATDSIRHLVVREHGRAPRPVLDFALRQRDQRSRGTPSPLA